MPSKTARQIKDIQIVKTNSITIKNDVRSGLIGAFGLGKFIHSALREINGLIAFDLQRDPFAVFKPAQRIHAFGPEKFAEQIDQAGAADSFRRDVANNLRADGAIG